MKVVIISGLSGAGKTRAADWFEDQGYYCIDNMPPQLIPSFAAMCNDNPEIQKVAIVTDIRGGAMFFKLEECVIEYHPPKSNYVNKCETCLHLWRPIYEEIPMPPMMYV